MSKVVKQAFWSNLGICVVKTVCACFTGSPSMWAESAHSAADTGNQGLLLWGEKASAKKADVLHPFGHGKKEYLCAFMVAQILFVLGGVYSLYEGISKILNPSEVHYPYLGLIVIGVSFILEFKSWYVARKELDCTNKELYQDLKDSKDSSVVTVFVEDTGALLGLGVAAIGILLSIVTGNPIFDAISSVIIGVLLFVMAFFLGYEMISLATGEAVDRDDLHLVRSIVEKFPHVKKVGSIKTMQMGRNSCIVGIDVDFKDVLHDYELEADMFEMKKEIRKQLPEAEYVFIQLQKIP